MDWLQRIDEDIKQAMKARDSLRRDVLRMVKAEIKNRQIQSGGALTEEDVQDVLIKEVKKRNEAIQSVEGKEQQYAPFLEQQRAELAILQEYLPQPLSEEELRQLIAETLAAEGITSRKDMGRAMKILMPKVRGRADGKRVNQLVQEMLQ